MSREIKFRAWDKSWNLMFQNDIMLKSGQELVTFAKRNSTNPAIQNAYGGLLLPTDDPDMVFMQYIGLKDKNGVEIYEGDIIQSYNEFGDRFSELSVIEWDGDIGCFKGVAIHLLNLEEVIGNIYEHPHLLGGEQK